MDLQLNDKIALVTGGGRGLGRAICLAFASEGADVAVNYHQDKDSATAVVARLAELGDGRATHVQADVSRAVDVARLFDTVEQTLGPIDIVINNAGVWPTAYVKDMHESDWDATMAIDLKGAFLVCREAVRRWLAAKRSGRIVNISTPAAFRGATTGHAHYAAAKAGLINLTVSLAREVAQENIAVNAIAAGMMRTDMAAPALANSEADYLQRIPLRRIADPAEVANVVVFLASERASYVTGATFDVSGGMLMR